MSKEASNEEVTQTTDLSRKDPNADLYENRGTKKIIRLVTVMAYMFSVSFVAIVLSAYYLFLWEPPNPKLLRRPVHLSSEPEVQFLLSDSPYLQNDDSTNNFHPEVGTGQKELNPLHQKIFGRTIDDTSNANTLVDNDNRYSGQKHRRTLNESLALLRSSLIEFIRNGNNESKSDKNSPKKYWLNSTNKSEDRAQFRARLKNINNETIDKDRDFPIIMNRTVSNNATSLTLETSTIRGDEVNNDSFTTNGNSYRSENILQLNNTSTANGNIVRKQIKRGILGSFRSVISKPGNSEIQVRRNDQFVSDRSNFSQNVIFTNRLKHVQHSTRPFTKQTYVATNLKETQIEKVLTKLSTMEQERTESSEIVTTQRQKNLLAILTEINQTVTNASPSTIVLEDLETNSSTENKEALTKL